MGRTVFFNAIGIVLILGLSACSSFHRRANNQGKPAATPLDVPKEPPASPAPGDAPKPSTDGLITDASAAPSATEGPTVTLVKKDGTTIENKPTQSPTDIIAKKEAEAQPPAPAPVTTGTTEKQWGYSSDNGPEEWGDLKSDYFLCRNGKFQSPVDLKWHRPLKGGQVQFKYKTSKAHISKDAHAVQADFESGNIIKIKGHPYDLLSAQFHSPSEHTLSGKQFPMELELLHKDSEGKTVIVSVFYKDGNENATVGKILSAIPSSPSMESGAELALQPQTLVPSMHTHYEYEGSITTPPCTEGVKWIVFNNPLHLSKDQIKQFQEYIPDNSRPVQPLNGRKVVNY